MPSPNPFDASTTRDTDDAFDLGKPSQLNSAGALLRGVAFTGQIITLALAKGVVIIGLIFGVLLMDDARKVDQVELLLPIGGAIFAVMLVAAFFVSKLLRSHGTGRLRQHPEVVAMREATPSNTTMRTMRDQWVNWDAKTPLPMPLRPFLANEQKATLVGQAMLESSAIINLVFALLDGSFAHFAFAFFAVVGLVSMIPTIGKLRSRIETALTPDGLRGF